MAYPPAPSIAPLTPLDSRPEWKALQTHAEKVRPMHLRELFRDDPKRGEGLAIEALDMHLDFSKQRVTRETLQSLLALAKACGVETKRDAMFRGEKINVAEGRAVLHVALRAPKGAKIEVEGKDVVPEVHAVLDAMADGVMVVDDEVWVGQFLRELLEDEGYAVSVFNNGRLALEGLGDGSGFGLIITDLTLPDMSGLELARAVRARQPALPMVLCTGAAELQTQQALAAAGIGQVLPKPIPMNDLKALVRSVMGARRDVAPA